MMNEKEIIKKIERDEWIPVEDIEKEKEKLKKAVESKYKKKTISIRLYEGDIKKLKKKSLETGIPYQTLISSLIHQYVEDRIKIEL